MDINKQKEKVTDHVEDQEKALVNKAKGYFKMATNKKSMDGQWKLNDGNIESAAELFGKGLGCFLSMYDARKWWQKGTFAKIFKSWSTGLNPVVDKINALLNTGDDGKLEAKAFENLTETLKKTMSKKHKLKSHQSILEDPNLVKAMTQISKGEEQIPDTVENIEKLQSDITAKNNNNDIKLAACLTAGMGGILGTGAGFAALVCAVGSAAAAGPLGWIALAGGIILVGGGFVAASLPCFRIPNENEKKLLDNLGPKLNSCFQKYIKAIKKGIKDEHESNKKGMNRENAIELKEIKE